MLKSKITRENLKDIGAEFLFENKCQPYAEGVNSAWDVFNSVVETFVLNYEDVEYLKKENEELKRQVEYLKERIKFLEK